MERGVVSNMDSILSQNRSNTSSDNTVEYENVSPKHKMTPANDGFCASDHDKTKGFRRRSSSKMIHKRRSAGECSSISRRTGTRTSHPMANLRLSMAFLKRCGIASLLFRQVYESVSLKIRIRGSRGLVVRRLLGMREVQGSNALAGDQN